MKRFILLLLIPAGLSAQTNNEEVVRRVADNIIRSTTFQFVNNKTGEKFADTKGKDTTNNVKAESKFNKWQYVNGVLTVGMVRLSNVSGNPYNLSVYQMHIHPGDPPTLSRNHQANRYGIQACTQD